MVCVPVLANVAGDEVGDVFERADALERDVAEVEDILQHVGLGVGGGRIHFI